MSQITIGLNNTESKNRIRFETVAERLQKINVDVLHSSSTMDKITPDTGSMGCFFQDELENWKKLATEQHFKRFQFEVSPKCQSLPELLYHKKAVVELLQKYISQSPASELLCYFQLLSALGRDLKDDIHVFFDCLMQTLLDVSEAVSVSGAPVGSNSANPELTAKLYECIAYLLKSQLSELTESPNKLLQYYGSSLGSSTQFVRRFAAKSFIIVIRKLKGKQFRNHFKKVIGAVCKNSEAMAVEDAMSFQCVPLETPHEFQRKYKRIHDLLDGVTSLIFHSLKGVKGCLHSKASERFQSLLEQLCRQDLLLAANEAGERLKQLDDTKNKKKADAAPLGESITAALSALSSPQKLVQFYVNGSIMSHCLVLMFRHVQPSNAVPLWDIILEHATLSCAAAQAILRLGAQSLGANSQALSIPLLTTLEMVIFAATHSNHRGLSDGVVKESIAKKLSQTVLVVADVVLSEQNASFFTETVIQRCRFLLCTVWSLYPAHADMLSFSATQLPVLLKPASAVVEFSEHLLHALPAVIAGQHFVKPLLSEIAQQSQMEPVSHWAVSLLTVLQRVKDFRPKIVVNKAGMQGKSMRGSSNNAVSMKQIHDREHARLEEWHSDEEGPDDTSEASEDASLVEDSAEGSQVDETDELLGGCRDELNLLLANCLKELEKAISAKPSVADHKQVLLLIKCCRWFATVHTGDISEGNRATFLKIVNKVFGGFDVKKSKLTTLLPTSVLMELVVMSSEFLSHGDAFSEVTNLAEATSNILQYGQQRLGSISVAFALNAFLDVVAGEEKHILSVLLFPEQQESLVLELGSKLTTGSYWLRYSLISLFEKLSPIETRAEKEENREVVDIAAICKEIVTLPCNISTCREFSRLLGIIEVLVRGDKLPLPYMRLLCSFCLGLLHVKFHPIWEAAVQVLVSAGAHANGENELWPLLLGCIEREGARCVEEASNDTEGSLLHMVAQLEISDDGALHVPAAVSSSVVFSMNIAPLTALDEALVTPDARTDTSTVYATLWSVLKKCPSITLNRSKAVVPIFLRFLTEQYYVEFADDTEIPFLRAIGLFAAHQESQSGKAIKLPIPVLKKRFELFLQIFAAVSSPKQLYQHRLLYAFYCEILSKPDGNIAKLALECIVTYKPAAIMPYKDNLVRLLDDKKIRDELVNFDISAEADVVQAQHRPELVPILVKIVFGRFVSKSKGSKTREQNQARRVAVLSFLAKLEAKEMPHLLFLMTRGILPQERLVDYTARTLHAYGSIEAASYDAWHTAMDAFITKEVTYADFQSIAWERQLGFLHLMEFVIRVIGFKLNALLPIVTHLLVEALKCAQERRDALNSKSTYEAVEDEVIDEEQDQDDEKSAGKFSNGDVQCSRVRTLSLQRLGELVTQYHAGFSFEPFAASLFAVVSPLLEVLPSSIKGNSRAPALLKLISAFAIHPQSVAVVATRAIVVQNVIRCIQSQCDVSVLLMVIDILNALLDYRGGACMLPYGELIIDSFSKKFIAPDSNSEEPIKLSELRVSGYASINMELRFLCRIATTVFQRKDIAIAGRAVYNLATLLLGLLRTYSMSKKLRIDEDWAINILKIYQSLVERVADVNMHVAFVSRLFGPASHSLSLFNSNNVRKELMCVYALLAQHPSTQGVISAAWQAMEELSADDPGLIGSKDFGRCMPVYQALSQEVQAEDGISWRSVLGFASLHGMRESAHGTAVVFEMVRSLYDGEMVLRTAAVSALKQLIVLCVEWTEASESDASMELLRSALVPAIRRGIKQSTDIVKKGFIQLLQTLAATCSKSEKIQRHPIDRETCHMDMVALMHVDPDQDFFENMMHIQLHRRSRAMIRLKAHLQQRHENGEAPFGVPTLLHILLSLGYHYVFGSEYQKKDHQNLMQEAAHFIGAVTLHLPWSHYYATIRVILKQLDKHVADKQKILLSTLCAVLDNFHFDLSSETELEGLQEIDNDRLRSLSRVDLTEDKEASKGKHKKRKGKRDHDEDVDAENDGQQDVLQQGNNQQNDVEEDEVAETIEKSAPQPKEESSKTIARTVINNIMPWVKVFLLKEEKDHKGNKSQVVQPHVAVALTKLIRRLEPPLVTEQYKTHLFVNLIINVVNTMKSRDSDARDLARDSLIKMILTLGIASLESVLYEMQQILREGFQRHVCNYSLRSILTNTMQEYTPPTDAPSVPIGVTASDVAVMKPVIPDFDRCIPLIINCVLDELHGEAQDDHDAEGAVRTVMREAKGNKANEIVEMSAKFILFRPTYALLCPSNPSSVSSIHALATPLLELLNSSNSSNTVLIGRVNEALQRIATGLSRNPSMNAQELMLYLHATLQPFVMALTRDLMKFKKAIGLTGKRKLPQQEEEENMFAVLDRALPSYLREESDDEEALYSKKRLRTEDDVSNYAVQSWFASELQARREQRAVVEERNREARKRIEVQDGASAPKLTGRNRYDNQSKAEKNSIRNSVFGSTDQSSLIAIRFCLSLFHSCLRQDRLDSGDETTRTMAIPFLPLLGKCLQLSGSSGVVALAIKCIVMLLVWGVPVKNDYAQALGYRFLTLLLQSGGMISTDNELAQVCMKGLSSLFKMYNESVVKFDEARAQKRDAEKPIMPLGEAQIRSLLHLLNLSITEITTSFQNVAFQLIREIIATKVMLPEIYDLVAKLGEHIVLSHRKGVRDAAAGIVTTFIICYPIGEKRVQSQISQLLQNLSYEFEDGRLSAIQAMHSLCKFLPVPVLETYASTMFLAMTLRMLNDKSAKCRQELEGVLMLLCRRVPTETFTQFQEYAWKWFGSNIFPANAIDGVQLDDVKHCMALAAKVPLEAAARPLIKTGATVMCLLLKAKPDAFKKASDMQKLLITVRSLVGCLLTSSESANDHRVSIEKRELARFAEGDGNEEFTAADVWTILYQLLSLVEQCYVQLPNAADSALASIDKGSELKYTLFELVQEALLFPHAWVRSVACRVIRSYFQRRSPVTESFELVESQRRQSGGGAYEFLLAPNALYQLARRFCVLINQSQLHASIQEASIPCIIFVARAMAAHPDLMHKTATAADAEEREESVDGEEVENALSDGEAHEEAMAPLAVNHKFAGANWLIQRLRAIGGDNRGTRRGFVLKVVGFLLVDCVISQVLLELVRQESGDFVDAYLNQFLEVAIRASNAVAATKHSHAAEASELARTKEITETTNELLKALEAKIGSTKFIGAFSSVQRIVEGSKSAKKRKLAAEAVINPQLFAERKVRDVSQGLSLINSQLENKKRKKDAQKRLTLRHMAVKGLSKCRKVSAEM